MAKAATKLINITSKNKKGILPGYLTTQGSNSSAPGVVVIQEWWGVNQQIKDQATNWFHSKGYTTLVPDLYRGEVAEDFETAGHLMNTLDWKGAIEDIQASVDYLKNIAKTPKVGTVGFCMGGALSLASAVHVKNLDCAAVFYGIPSRDLADPKEIKIPLQLHFGQKDDLKGFSSPEDQKNLVERIKEGDFDHSKHETHFDYRAGHAFTNKKRPECYSESDTNLARERLYAFFKRYLDG
ncbi:hypothetical protein MHBO_002405 [Bonamia ostreae]|uniref:Dienelactone hydrolase domain-containing protein n=1 Tax=Bonamia ostreae TaxID=126728 RepID=A0ABV2AM79_9EUKA